MNGPIVVASHPRSGTHLTLDTFRRQFRECRSWKYWGEPLDRLYLNLESLMRRGLAERYEVEAVADNGYRFGGMRNSSIPNYIYRWTEREVRKTIDCASPHAHHAYRFFYQFRPPTRRLAMHRSRAVRLAGRVLDLGAGLLEPIAARQGNLFAFFVRKPSFPDDLHPWLRLEDGTVVPDRAWCEARLDPGGAVRR